MKKEQAYMLFFAVFFVGYLAGRATSKQQAAAPAAATAVAAAPSQQVATAAPAPTSAPPPPAYQPPPPPPAAAAPAKPASDQIWRVKIHKDDAVMGSDNAPVKVVILTGFGCQACTDFWNDAKRAYDEYKGKVQFRFKHKIIPPQHPDSVEASEAAACAGKQGKFWPFHNKLMDNPFNIGRSALDQYAKETKVRMRKWKKCMKKHEAYGMLTRDSVIANETGSHSFPNVLANGVRIGKPKNYESLKALIEKMIPRAEAMIKSGTKPRDVYDRSIASGKFFPQTEGRRISFKTSDSPTFGPKSAKVEVVVYEDFQCPFCSKLAPNLKLFAKMNPGKVKIVYKHMPLISIHTEAQLASEASMEAHAQGKFWEYHDKLYENQQALKKNDLISYAQAVGLNMPRFQDALQSRKHKAFVDADSQEGQRAGITGTPSVFINGLKYAGPRGYPPAGLDGVARLYMGL
jgi:protein-disulfide isomerase